MKISVILTSYNYQEYIKYTIQSVLNQTYQDWELIIIDDCSTDNSVEIIKSFNDERIKLIVNDRNLQLEKSIKKGLEISTGEWVAFLESDDIWNENYLEEKVKIIEQYPDTAVIFNDIEMFGEREKCDFMKRFSESFLNKIKSFKYPKNIFLEIIKFNSVMTFSAATANKEKFINCFYKAIKDNQIDWQIFIYLAKDYDFYYIPQKLTKWRMHSNSYIKKYNRNLSLPVNILTLYKLFLEEKNIKYLLLILKIIPVCIYKKFLT